MTKLLIFFCQFEPQMLLFLFLFIHVLINCNLYTWQLLHSWPVQKTGNFPLQKGKKEILKNFPKYKSKNIFDLIGHGVIPQTVHHYWTLFLKSISWLLWNIFVFLTEHNLSITLLLICSYFFTKSELQCSYKVRSYKKKSIVSQFLQFNENNILTFSRRI